MVALTTDDDEPAMPKKILKGPTHTTTLRLVDGVCVRGRYIQCSGEVCILHGLHVCTRVSCTSTHTVQSFINGTISSL
jgi:hypothetical protein